MHINYQKKRSRSGQTLPIIGAITVVALVLNFALNPASLSAALKPDPLPKLILGCFFPLFLTLSPLLVRHNLRKQFRRSPVLSEVRTLDVDDTGLDFSSASASGRQMWAVYSGFAEDKYNFLLVQQGSLIFVPIPKSGMSDSEQAELRSILAAHLPAK
jgi:hypothetical protein